MKHTSRPRWAWAVAAALLLAAMTAGVAIMAQEKPQAPAQSAQKKEPEQVHGQADSWKTSWGTKKTVLMKGNVEFTHGDTVLTSDQVDYDDEAKVAVSPGKINITDPECDISGDKGSAYFKKKLGIVEGNVVMRLKPKNVEEEPADSQSVRAKLTQPTTITCQKLEYLYKDKIATATGGVVFKQTNRTASAQQAVYDEKKELLTLSGGVNGKDEYGQTFSAPGTVIMSLKKGDEWMEAEDASASFKIDLGEE